MLRTYVRMYEYGSDMQIILNTHTYIHTYIQTYIAIYLLKYFYGALLAIYVPEEHNKNDKSIVQTFELKVPEIFSTSNFFIS